MPRTTRDSTAPRIGRMERISWSRFCRACRVWHVCVCRGGRGGARRKIGVALSDGRKRCCRVLTGRGDRNRCALRVLIRR